jgi:hypothetical protein
MIALRMVPTIPKVRPAEARPRNRVEEPRSTLLRPIVPAAIAVMPIGNAA